MISKWGTLFLIIMTLPIMGHVVILPLMLNVAGRDGWISILCAVPLGVIFAYAVYRLRVKFSDHDFIQKFTLHTSKWFGLPLRFLLIAYMLFLSVFSLATLLDMTHFAFLPQTPIPLLSLFFMIFCFYAVYKGVRAIALTAGILGLLGMFTGHTVTALATPEKKFVNIFPIFEFGFAPSLWGILILCSIWIELLFLLLIPIENIKEKRMFLFWTVGVFLNGLMMMSTLTGSIMIFGMSMADQFVYPALQTVRIISLGFIERFDIYGLMLMSFGCYIRISLFLRLGFQLMLPVNMQNKLWGRILLLGLAICVMVLGAYIAYEHLRIARTMMYYSWLVFMFPLPFILLLIPKRKKERRKAI